MPLARTKPYEGGSIPETYEHLLVPILFADYGAELARQVDVPNDGAVLEIACGTGAVTRHLARRIPAGARLAVTDISPAMIEVCRRVVDGAERIDYCAADAGDLPFGDAQFDAAICQFSAMLFPDRRAAFSEAARVLRPGGILAFNTWDRIENNGFSHAVHHALARVYPKNPPKFLEAPYSAHDLTALVRDLQDVGFGPVAIEVQPRVSRADGPRDVAAALMRGSPLANELAGRDDPDPDTALGKVEMQLIRDLGSGAITAPMQAFQFVARRHR